MRNIKFICSFNGQNYSGFQIQPNKPTIQGELEKALGLVLTEKIAVNGCSRTDSGVHAREFCFNVKTVSSIPNNGLMKALNDLLPGDIAINSCEDVDAEFHARFDAKGKEYVYLVYSGEKNAFLNGTALNYNRTNGLPLEKLNKAAQIFIGRHDFAAFCKAEAKQHLKSTIREITGFRVMQNGIYTEFYVTGNGFLHNMVRIVIGTLIYIAEDKRTEKDVLEAFATGDREKAGKTLPPDGLYLNRVFY